MSDLPTMQDGGREALGERRSLPVRAVPRRADGQDGRVDPARAARGLAGSRGDAMSGFWVSAATEGLCATLQFTHPACWLLRNKLPDCLLEIPANLRFQRSFLVGAEG